MAIDWSTLIVEIDDDLRSHPAVWDGSCAPGGYVCARKVPGNPDGICGVPVESEPCGEHDD